VKSSNCMRTHSVVPLLSRGCAIVARFLREETHKSRRSKFLDDFPRLFVDEYIHEARPGHLGTGIPSSRIPVAPEYSNPRLYIHEVQSGRVSLRQKLVKKSKTFVIIFHTGCSRGWTTIDDTRRTWSTGHSRTWKYYKIPGRNASREPWKKGYTRDGYEY